MRSRPALKGLPIPLYPDGSACAPQLPAQSFTGEIALDATASDCAFLASSTPSSLNDKVSVKSGQRHFWISDC